MSNDREAERMDDRIHAKHAWFAAILLADLHGRLAGCAAHPDPRPEQNRRSAGSGWLGLQCGGWLAAAWLAVRVCRTPERGTGRTRSVRVRVQYYTALRLRLEYEELY